MTRKYPIDYLTNYFNNLENKETYIKNSWLIVPKTLVILINDFLNFKNINGSDIEKKIYKNMTQDQFIFRLFAKRPLVFVGGSDSWTLRDNTQGFGNWETIGTNNEKSPLTLYEYLSYDENGILQPNEKMDRGLLDDIMTYFKERNEDEI